MRTSARLSALTFAAVFAGGAATIPHQASAQPVPSYAQGAPAPQAREGQETISGTISLVQGEYLEITDDRGYTDRVDFTTDTVMRPSGIALRRGMRVRVTGYNQGQIFDAYEIDSANAPAYGGNSSPTYGYNPQPAAPVPEGPPPQAVAQAPLPPAAAPQALPPYATPLPPQPYGPQPVYAPVYAPVYVPYPVYAYPVPPPAYYSRYPRFYVRLGVRF